MATLNPVNKPYLLSEICESNFHALGRLAPGFSQISGSSIAFVSGNPVLYLKLLNRSPYTLTLEMTHCFGGTEPPQFEPAIRLQVYLDARSVEVLYPTLPQGNAPHSPEQILDYKWNKNYFLQKWLKHCIASGYRFDPLEVRNNVQTLDREVQS